MNTHVNFEIAKLLKPVGYDKPTGFYYLSNGTLIDAEELENDGSFGSNNFPENWNKEGWVVHKNGGMCFGCKLDNIKYFEAYSAPIIVEVIMWLYKKHGIWISVWEFTYKDGLKVFKNNIISYAEYNHPTEAYEAAISYTLKNLVK